MAWVPVGAIGDTGDGDEISVLTLIANAVKAIASAKGVLSDLRVTPTGTVTIAGTVGISANQDLRTVTTVTGLTNVGTYSAAPATLNWQNQTAISGFVNNIVRS